MIAGSANIVAQIRRMRKSIRVSRRAILFPSEMLFD